MTDRKLFFYSLTVTLHASVGASAHVQPKSFYFPTQNKLDRWKKKNPDLAKDITWAMHEISLDCVKDMIKLSKKKIKEKCHECGK